MTSPYYETDGITLYHGDCREVPEWLTADVLIVDPPYGVSYTDRRGQGVRGDQNFTLAAEVILLAEPRPMAVFANHDSLPATLEAVRRVHSRMRTAVWHKTNVNGATPGNPWLADVEFAVCGVPEWPRQPVSALMSARRFTGNPAWNASPDAYLHPTQKPVPLLELLIQAMPAGVVADPCAGSGTTLVAARAQGRCAIGVELEERYCEIIAKRLDRLDLFGGVA